MCSGRYGQQPHTLCSCEAISEVRESRRPRETSFNDSHTYHTGKSILSALPLRHRSLGSVRLSRMSVLQSLWSKVNQERRLLGGVWHISLPTCVVPSLYPLFLSSICVAWTSCFQLYAEVCREQLNCWPTPQSSTNLFGTFQLGLLRDQYDQGRQTLDHKLRRSQ